MSALSGVAARAFAIAGETAAPRAIVARTAARTAAADLAHSSGARVKDVYQTIGKWDLFNRISAGLSGILPQWQHGIQVTVAGGPKSSIKRLWYLCLSAAFGRYRERVSYKIQGITLQAQWDISNKIVSVELVYQGNAWATTANAAASLTGQISLPSATPLARIARGPEQVTVGGSWPIDFLPTGSSDPDRWVRTVGAPSWYIPAPCPDGTYTSMATLPMTGIGGARNIGTGQELSGVPSTPPTANSLSEYPIFTGIGGGSPSAGPFASASIYPFFGIGPLNSGSVWPQGIDDDNGVYVTDDQGLVVLPTLIDDGRIITTGEHNDPYVQPPRPIVDGHTRSGLLALVAQSLNNPCFLPMSAPCTYTPQASSGRYVYNPGTPLNDAAAQVAITGARGSSDITPLVSPDGYQFYPNAGGQAINEGGE